MTKSQKLVDKRHKNVTLGKKKSHNIVKNITKM